MLIGERVERTFFPCPIANSSCNQPLVPLFVSVENMKLSYFMDVTYSRPGAWNRQKVTLEETDGEQKCQAA
jgi:hypothetical protein